MTRPLLEHDWFPRPLPDNVVVGDGTWVYSSFAFLHYQSTRPCGLRLGRGCGVYINTLFDLGPSGEVEIGDFTTLAGPLFSTNGRVVIGNHVLFSSQVVVADSFAAIPPRGPAPAAADAPETTVVVEDLAWISTRAVLLAGARIRHGAIVGANTVVDFEVPPYAIVAGDPPRVVGWSRPRPPAGEAER
ncbi:MAG: acyltransferase [Actinomycetota bacterium]